jgi:hypothetical protein
VKADFDPVQMAIPFFVIAVILEIVLARMGKAKAHYETRDTATSLAMGLGSTIAGALLGGVFFAATVWVWQHRVFTIPMTAVWAWVVLFFAEDLTYYWFHRIAHERRFWWASHVNHHTSTHYNLSTALRQTWTGGVAGTWLLWLKLRIVPQQRQAQPRGRPRRQDLAAEAEQLGRAAAGVGVLAAQALDQVLALDHAAEVLLVQRHAGDGLDRALQGRQGELGRHQFEHHGAVLDLAPEAREPVARMRR